MKSQFIKKTQAFFKACLKTTLYSEGIAKTMLCFSFVDQNFDANKLYLMVLNKVVHSEG